MDDDPTPTCYLPDFLPRLQEQLSDARNDHPDDHEARNKVLESLAKDYAKENWLTDGLIDEIQSCYPTRNDIDTQNSNRRDQNAFAENCLQLFSAGRCFASNRQFLQAAAMFLDQWGVKPNFCGKYVFCSFCTHGKKRKLHDDPTKRRNTPVSAKEQYQCPFRINITPSECFHTRRDSDNWRPLIFYPVKVTRVNVNHTCQLSTDSVRYAYQRSTTAKLDLDQMNLVISHIKQKPHISASELRPLLLKHLPHFQHVDASMARNFRNRAINFLARHPDGLVTMDEVDRLNLAPLSAQESTNLDNPLFRQNAMDILRQVMQDSGQTWDALAFLQKAKGESPGFDFRIKYNSSGRPEALQWMTSEMRKDAIRFGDILFLDARKAQMNDVNWPYIAPVVKDENMKVRPIAEALCCEESHVLYQWVLEAIQDMEPRFQLNKIRFIFADQGITSSLLTDLRIDNTCTLRCDQYHMLNEVWPPKFGTSLFHSRLKPFLLTMLRGSREEWEAAYDDLLPLLIAQPALLQEVRDIYGNPSYYAGWYLREQPGNLMLGGSTASEQNHSSVAVTVARSGNWSLAENITKLMERCEHARRARQSQDSHQAINADRYRSSLRGPSRGWDEDAKKNLSHFAYSNLFIKSNSIASYLTYHTTNEGDAVVYKAGQTPESNSTVRIPQGERCPCQFRIAYRFQCAHELAADGQFHLNKYDVRWLQQRKYDGGSPLVRDGFDEESIGADDDDGGSIGDGSIGAASLESQQTTRTLDSAADDIPLSMLGRGDGSVSYSRMREAADLVIRLVQGKSALSRSFLNTMNVMKERLRNNILDIDVTFSNILQAGETRTPTELQGPVPGALSRTPNASNVQRLRSRNELRNGEIRRRAQAIRSQPAVPDSHVVQPGASNRRACTLCCEPGHRKGRCPRVRSYGGTVLPFGNTDVRTDLARDLRHPLGVFDILEDIPMQPTKSFPSGTKGIVISAVSYNCVCCTLLKEAMMPDEVYTDHWFSVETVCNYIVRSKNNVIVNTLDRSNRPQRQPLSQNTANWMSQESTLAPMPIFTQPASQMDAMGYGLSEPI